MMIFYNVIVIISIQHSNYFDLSLLFTYDVAENQEMVMIITAENLSWKRLTTERLCKTVSMTNLVCSVTKHMYSLTLQYLHPVYILQVC